MRSTLFAPGAPSARRPSRSPNAPTLCGGQHGSPRRILLSERQATPEDKRQRSPETTHRSVQVGAMPTHPPPGVNSPSSGKSVSRRSVGRPAGSRHGSRTGVPRAQSPLFVQDPLGGRPGRRRDNQAGCAGRSWRLGGGLWRLGGGLWPFGEVAVAESGSGPHEWDQARRV